MSWMRVVCMNYLSWNTDVLLVHWHRALWKIEVWHIFFSNASSSWHKVSHLVRVSIIASRLASLLQEVMHQCTDQMKNLCPRRGKSRGWSRYGETFGWKIRVMVKMGVLEKTGSFGEKRELWWKMGVLVKMGAMVRPSAPAIAIPPLPALLPATGVDMATPPGPTCI